VTKGELAGVLQTVLIAAGLAGLARGDSATRCGRQQGFWTVWAFRVKLSLQDKT
jgi:hypothetical protein